MEEKQKNFLIKFETTIFLLNPQIFSMAMKPEEIIEAQQPLHLKALTSHVLCS